MMAFNLLLYNNNKETVEMIQRVQWSNDRHVTMHHHKISNGSITILITFSRPINRMQISLCKCFHSWLF